MRLLLGLRTEEESRKRAPLWLVLLRALAAALMIIGFARPSLAPQQISGAATGPLLLVIDDGKGFDPLDSAAAGMGLRIMRFRAQLLGGYLSVESRPGAGTTLRCRCPVEMGKEAA